MSHIINLVNNQIEIIILLLSLVIITGVMLLAVYYVEKARRLEAALTHEKTRHRWTKNELANVLRLRDQFNNMVRDYALLRCSKCGRWITRSEFVKGNELRIKTVERKPMCMVCIIKHRKLSGIELLQYELNLIRGDDL